MPAIFQHKAHPRTALHSRHKISVNRIARRAAYPIDITVISVAVCRRSGDPEIAALTGQKRILRPTG
jgi:hypothetical protein